MDIVYRCKNTRKCYWLCRECLKGHSYGCSPKCPDYLSIAKVKKERGIPKKAITDDIFYKVRKGVESAWEGWPEVVKGAISYALKD